VTVPLSDSIANLASTGRIAVKNLLNCLTNNIKYIYLPYQNTKENVHGHFVIICEILIFDALMEYSFTMIEMIISGLV
jgi:hypothetical protein